MEKELDMLRRIECPHCGKQLNIPLELAGKKLACPRCSNQFRFEPERFEREQGEDPSIQLDVVPPNPDLYPPGTAPPAQTTSPQAPSSKPALSKSAPPQPAASEAAQSQPEPPRSDATIEKPPKAAKTVETSTARFIKRDANATQVKLGADGQLPDLALATQEKRVEGGDDSKTSNPWVLISVLCISVLMSVLILVIDEPMPGTAEGKGAARQKLQSIFASWDRNDAPAHEIRDLLARASQAYNRGDYEQEEEYYRQILDLLNREDAPKYGGFSGDDNTLKETISEMLR